MSTCLIVPVNIRIVIGQKLDRIGQVHLCLRSMSSGIDTDVHTRINTSTRQQHDFLTYDCASVKKKEKKKRMK